ncbi:hypothetical protein A6A04_00040 [Paramagnetospirillum marisnigri]|uniref:OmpA-like domain-containing protein n=1 Tax=Paramagnetospirillum marisnigri TaxID=1285242 RepID=A0A178MRL5_9PROT|nr:OmpA family protein [Paramagnetospirillum marisnigri]OAN52139.1 hypothetical protein A6A04_00040 [Paramagnetospirillum marisnigri]
MLDCIEAWRRRHERHAIIVGKTVVAAALITGCSYVPDAVNPVEWYKGVAGVFSDDEAPEVATPKRAVADASAEARRQPARGLNSDASGPRYADSVKREPNPTKQLARKNPPAETKVAEAAPSGRLQPARDEGPAAPPQAVAGGPPPRADIPDQVPTRRTLLSDHYQRRLSESQAATNKNDPFATVPPPRSEASYNQPVHTYAVPAVAPAAYAARPAYAADVDYGTPQLVAPKSVRGPKGSSVPRSPAASFEVAALQFGADGGLTATDRAALREVARLQKQTGGVVRVLGQAPSGAISFAGEDDQVVASRRAQTVAKALTGLGVPARKVLVAADPSSGGYDDSGARVSIEY